MLFDKTRLHRLGSAIKTPYSKLAQSKNKRPHKTFDFPRGWLMLARIGVLKALRRGVVREFNPARKDTHWGNAEAA
jgi:hypothetical protein